MLNLAQEQKFELAEKLLKCPQLSTPSGRVTVAGQLSERVHNHIRLGATNTPKEEVLALIEAAANVERGIAELVEVLAFFDGGSIPFEAVQVYVDALGFGGLLPFNSNLLPARNPKFVGREQELASLHNTLQDTNMVAVTALHGLGGVGKTSLAIEYIYRHQKAYNLIAWLPAENRLTLELEFIGLLGVLGLPDMPIDTEENRAAAVGAVKRELARRGKGWLLVFDNAEKPEDVEAFRPGGAAGHVIVTSRNRQMAKLGSAVGVDVLTEGDALKLLAAHCYSVTARQVMSTSPEPEATAGFEHEEHAAIEGWPVGKAGELAAARELAAKLGYLALAITQAGAYIFATECGIANYLTDFKQAAFELFGEDFAQPGDYQHSVATTWEVSFNRIKTDNPLAAEFLNLLAFFAPDGIRLAWFSSPNAEAKASLPAGLTELTENSRKLNQVLATLLGYSLVTRDGQGEQLGMHRLVQLVMRERLGSEQVTLVIPQEQAGESGDALEPEPDGFSGAASTYWYNQAVRFLAASFPDETEYANLAECGTLISHLQALIDYASLTYFTRSSGSSSSNRRSLGSPPHTFTGEGSGANLNHAGQAVPGLDLVWVGTLFARAANYYYGRALYPEARPLYERALAIGEKTLGSDHPNLAIWLNNLANLLQDTGEYAAARPLYERALAIGEKTLGSDHPSLAIRLNGLADLLKTIGDYAAARPLYERALAIGEKTLGSDHPSLAIWLNNLAGLLHATGDYAAAKPLYERALAIGEKTLGSDHPSLAIRLSNLAGLLKATGEYAAARLLYERALAIDEKTLGSDHPEYAASLNNLGSLLADTGDYAAARPLYERAIAITEKTLGGSHPRLGIRLGNLAGLLYITGEPDKALPMLKRALAIFQEKLGSTHPNTIRITKTLSRWEIELADN